MRGDVRYFKEKYVDWFSYGTLDTGDNALWVIDGKRCVEALERAIERNKEFEDALS